MNFEFQEAPQAFLERRVDRLEREIRSHRRFTSIILLCIGAGVIVLLAKQFNLKIPLPTPAISSAPSAAEFFGRSDFSKNQYLRDEMHPNGHMLLKGIVAICKREEQARKKFAADGRKRGFESFSDTPEFEEFEEKKGEALEELRREVGAPDSIYSRDGKRFSFEILQYLLDAGVDGKVVFGDREDRSAKAQ